MFQILDNEIGEIATSLNNQTFNFQKLFII